ncbi:hypothetical protein SteCoe_86 [Stentor coeruleus]|uniref:TH1 domain-containing protein n=1 Tax=Stentor coeruleus TaxID=5963 RepID=A0A1R2D509_9CILI|nr:hypothetical protein SteCoe_86 [Stentor coeruleus]
MGNSCCTGRLHQKKLDLTKNSKVSLPLELPFSNINQNSQNKASTNIFENSLSLEKIPKTQPNVSFLKETDSDLILYSIDEESDYKKLNTVNYFSHRSEINEGLNYTLINPEDLSKPQQKKILECLDRFNYSLGTGEIEEVDGFAYIEENKKNHMMMITTHAIYLLKPEDLSLVSKRVILEDVTILVISKNKDTLLIANRVNKADFCISCDNIDNIVKSIQQVSNEAFGQYVPWIVCEKGSDVLSMLYNVNIDEKKLFNEQHLAILKIIVEHGDIGENEILVENTCSKRDGQMINGIFVVTESAIYHVDTSYAFVKRIDLKNIDKIVYTNRENCMAIYEDLDISEYNLKIGVCEKVRQAASECRKMIKVVIDNL